MSLTPLEIVLFVLSGLYIPLVVLPLVQLIRIHFRAPEVGWTTQKLFLTLTALSSIGNINENDFKLISATDLLKIRKRLETSD